MKIEDLGLKVLPYHLVQSQNIIYQIAPYRKDLSTLNFNQNLATLEKLIQYWEQKTISGSTFLTDLNLSQFKNFNGTVELIDIELLISSSDKRFLTSIKATILDISYKTANTSLFERMKKVVVNRCGGEQLAQESITWIDSLIRQINYEKEAISNLLHTDDVNQISQFKSICENNIKVSINFNESWPLFLETLEHLSKTEDFQVLTSILSQADNLRLKISKIIENLRIKINIVDTFGKGFDVETSNISNDSTQWSRNSLLAIKKSAEPLDLEIQIDSALLEKDPMSAIKEIITFIYAKYKISNDTNLSTELDSSNMSVNENLPTGTSLLNSILDEDPILALLKSLIEFQYSDLKV